MSDKGGAPVTKVGGVRVGARTTRPKAEAGVEPAELVGHAPNEFKKYGDDTAPSVSPATLLTVAIVYIAVVILGHFWTTMTK